MATELDAKEAAIIKLMNGFPSSSKITDGQIDAYLEAVSGVSAEAVARSCRQFLTGAVTGHNNAFLPTAAEVAANAAMWDSIIASTTTDRELNRLVSYRQGELPPPGYSPLGPLEVDFGHGRINMRGMTHEEKEEVLRTGKRLAKVDGKILKPQMKRI